MEGSAGFGKNNLDCLRLILASIVVFFHIYALTNIDTFSVFDKYLSRHFAIKSFFVISGLLIYWSYSRSSSIGSYFEKRFRRIYPAYFTVIVVSAVAFFALSSLPAKQYFGIGFWQYLGANLLFLNFLAPSLPGVFMSNANTALNGALWTLKIEVAFYLFVPIMHYSCRKLGTKATLISIFGLSCLWKYGFMGLAKMDNSREIYTKMQVEFPAQLVYFTAGVLLLLYYDKLKYHFRSISIITICVFAVDHWLVGGVLDVIWVSGFVFVFGFGRYFGNFSKFGDFSYSVYIVHWPILQTLISVHLPRLAPMFFLTIALLSIFMASVLIWNLVESRFLGGSSHYRQAQVMALR